MYLHTEDAHHVDHDVVDAHDNDDDGDDNNNRDVDDVDIYPWQKTSKTLHRCCCLYFGTKLSICLQIVLTLTAGGSMVFGVTMSLLNTSISVIGAQFRWCGCESYTGCFDFELKSAFMQSGIFLGAAVGAYAAGQLLQRTTCRNVLYTAFFFNVIGAMFSTGANAFTDLLMARMVDGLAVGIVAVAVPTYISETMPPKLRGSLGVLHQITITFGVFLAVLIGLPLELPPAGVPTYCFEADGSWASSWVVPTFNRVWWRVMMGVGAIPSIVGIIGLGYIFPFETPYYLFKVGRAAEARVLLKFIMETDDVDEDAQAIQHQVESSVLAKENSMSLIGVMKDPEGRWALFVGTGIAVFQQVTGMNVFITSSDLLFASAGLTQNLVTILTIVLTFINFLMTLPSVWLIERLGRRVSLLIGAAGMGLVVLPGGILLLVLGDSPIATWISIAGAVLFIIFFAPTWGPVVWVYVFEIFPTRMKDSAGGFMIAVNRLAAMIIVFAGSFMPTSIAYLLFFGLSVLAFLFALFFMKETRGIRVGASPFFREVDKNTLLSPSTGMSE